METSCRSRGGRRRRSPSTSGPLPPIDEKGTRGEPRRHRRGPTAPSGAGEVSRSGSSGVNHATLRKQACGYGRKPWGAWVLIFDMGTASVGPTHLWVEAPRGPPALARRQPASLRWDPRAGAEAKRVWWSEATWDLVARLLPVGGMRIRSETLRRTAPAAPRRGGDGHSPSYRVSPYPSAPPRGPVNRWEGRLEPLSRCSVADEGASAAGQHGQAPSAKSAGGRRRWRDGPSKPPRTSRWLLSPKLAGGSSPATVAGQSSAN